MEKMIFFTIPMAITIPVTVLLCRARLSHRFRISFGTVLFSAFVVTFFWCGFTSGGEIYTVGFWHGYQAKPIPRGLILKFVAFIFLMCVLSALGVVHYYQRKSKENDKVFGVREVECSNKP